MTLVYLHVCFCVFLLKLSPIIKHCNLEKWHRKSHVLFFFSPWGSLGLGRQVHTLENCTPTEIHQRFCHQCADISNYTPTQTTCMCKISWDPPLWHDSKSYIDKLSSGYRWTENFVLTADFRRTETVWLAHPLLFLQCTRSVTKSRVIWVFSVPISVGFLTQLHLTN